MRKIYFTLVWIVVCVYSQAYAQNQQVLDSLNRIYKTAPQDSTKILALADIAYLYYMQYDTCLALCEKGIEWSEKIGYPIGKGRCYTSISASYYRVKDNYFVALSYAQKALEISEKYQDLKGQRLALNMIGMTHFSLENYEQALLYFQKCVDVSEKNNDLYGISENTLNVGMVFEKQKRYREALEIQRKTILVAQKDKNEYEAYSLSYIGNIYLEQNQFDSAIYYLTKGLVIEEKFNDLYLQAYTLVRLGKAYQKQNQFEKAIQYAEQTLVIANRMNLLTEKRDAYAILYEVYKNKTQYQKAMQYLELSKQANDSLTNTEKAKSVANLENKMNLDKKNQELALLKAEQTQKDTEQRFWLFLVSGGFIFMFVFALFVFRSRNKIKEAHTKISSAHLEIQEQKKEIQVAYEEIQTNNEELRQVQEEILAQKNLLEEKNEILELFSHKITASIQSAKLIQHAILPSKEKINDIFTDNFVLFMPKDVVSGDFYWVHSVSKYRFLVVADCTGHGVSGAFMTMIGNGLLDRILRFSQIYEPQEILISLNEQIRILLQQEQTQNNDGMDIGVLRIEEHKIVFAGAKRPLYVVQNEKIEKIAGVRKSVGGHQNDKKTFSQTELTWQSPTTFYLSTDGYADQNNLERNSFSEKRLINLLEESQNLALQEQKEVLENTMRTYMTNTEQRDDILVVGISI